VNPVSFEILALAEAETAWGPPSLTTKRLLGSILERPGEVAPLDELLLALACRRMGMVEEGEGLAKRAEQRPIRSVSAAAVLLQLQAARGRETAPAIRYLLAHRVGKGWRGTMESAMAILGLTAALERSEATPGRVLVQANGGPAREIALPG